jgi:hypothetical protein
MKQLLHNILLAFSCKVDHETNILPTYTLSNSHLILCLLPNCFRPTPRTAPSRVNSQAGCKKEHTIYCFPTIHDNMKAPQLKIKQAADIL